MNLNRGFAAVVAIAVAGCIGQLGPTIAWKSSGKNPTFGWQASGGIFYAQAAAGQSFDDTGTFTYGAVDVGAWNTIREPERSGLMGLGGVSALLGGGWSRENRGVVLALGAGGAAGKKWEPLADDTTHFAGGGVMIGIRVRGGEVEAYAYPHFVYVYIPEMYE